MPLLLSIVSHPADVHSAICVGVGKTRGVTTLGRRQELGRLDPRTGKVSRATVVSERSSGRYDWSY